MFSCLGACSRNPACVSVNVCPLGPAALATPAVCAMFDSTISDVTRCTGLSLASYIFQNCFHVIKEEEVVTTALSTTEPQAITSDVVVTTETPMTTSPVNCQNGGIPSTQHLYCKCPPEYAGDFCERYPIDCQEIVDSAPHLTNRVNSSYFIKQPGFLDPIPVDCRFTFKGFTDILVWANQSAMDLPSLTYFQLQKGVWFSDSFFIGLDTWHLMLAQETYELVMNVTYFNGTTHSDNMIVYHDFYFGPKSEQYNLTYASVAAFGDAPNAWPVLPARFHTADNLDSCTNDNGFDGWMAEDCFTEASLFVTNGLPPRWILKNGEVVEVVALKFSLTRNPLAGK